MLDKESVLISNAKLVYIPFWEVTLSKEQEKYVFLINGLDDKDVEQKLMPFIKEKILQKELESEYDLFIDTLKEFTNIKTVFYGILDLISLILRYIYNFFKWLYTKSKLGFYLLIILILIAFYYIVW